MPESFTTPSTIALTETMLLANMRLSPTELRLYAPDETPIALERKAFDVLCYLIAQRERVVSKDELLQQVWGRSIASDTVIAQAVSKARKALAIGGGESEWIDVARGVGYRYVGPAEVAIPTTLESGASRTRRARVGWPALALLSLTLALGVFGGMWWQRQAILRDPLRIAVLPWRDDSGDASLQWSSLGLQALMVDALANDRRIAPLPQGSVGALLAARPDLVDSQAQAEYLAAATGVRHVLAGRLARAGDGVVVELMVMGEGPPISTRVQGNDPALLALAAGSDVTQALLPGFDPSRPPPLSRIAFANEAYARGVDARLRGRAEEAAQYLRSALGADPKVLAARYQLSIALQLLRDNESWKATLDLLLEDARAQQDRVHEGLALTGLGLHAWREGRLEQAEALIRESISLFNGPADAIRRAGAAANLGSLAAIQGRFDEAESGMQQSLAQFVIAGQLVEVARVSKNLGVLNVDRGRFDAARQLFERSLELRQSLGLEREIAETLVSLGATDLGLESPAAAQASFERAIEMFTRFNDPLMQSDALARLASAQIAQGRLLAAQESAGRSLAAARIADNPAALGLAHQRLAMVSRLRDDRASALAELDRAQVAMAQAQDSKGLARIALDRIALAAPEHAVATRELIDDVLAGVRERGWRGLEAEALALRGAVREPPDRAGARADLAAAHALAEAIGEPALITDLACRYAALDPKPLDAQQQRAESHCLDAAARNPEAARLRAQRAEQNADISEALRWWQRRKQLLGEAWFTSDQAQLEALESR